MGGAKVKHDDEALTLSPLFTPIPAWQGVGQIGRSFPKSFWGRKFPSTKDFEAT